MTDWPAYHFKIGDRVTGANCFGAPLSGTVTATPSPWTVVLDGFRWVPVGLITGRDVTAQEPKKDKGERQLSLF